MKGFKNIMLIPLHVIDPQLFGCPPERFTFGSFPILDAVKIAAHLSVPRSFGYASQKLLQFENQSHTNHFNISSKTTSMK